MTEKAVIKKPSVLGLMAAKFKLDEKMFLDTVKATVMKPGKDGKIPSNEEIAAFLIVANKYDLDPFTNEIYAFLNKKGGIIPIVGVDGFVTIMNRQTDFNGYEITYDEDETTMEGAKSCPKWAEVKIYHKDREHATVVREYLDEVYVPARGGFTGPWQTHTKRMLRHKVLIQGIRVAFGITGIYDPDEGERIIDAQIAPAPQIAEPQPKQPEDNRFKAMLEKFAKAKETIGDEMYYTILGNNGFEHANEIRELKTGEKVLQEMRDYAATIAKD